MTYRHLFLYASFAALLCFGSTQAKAPRKPKKPVAPALTYPPTLPGGKELVSDTSNEFLSPPAGVNLKPGVAIAKTAPTIDFQYYPGQDYPGKPWSNWGDSLAINGKYYASIGDHLAPSGNAFVYEYDPQTKKLRRLLEVKKLLNLPEGHYTPGKIHGRLDMGSDGYLYFSTHRGATNVTTDKFHYLGDWIIRHDPKTGKSEVVAQGPVPKHCIPNSVLDPQRLIFYGGTAAGIGKETSNIHFFAYDVKNKKLLYDGPNGPARYMIFAQSTGRIYFTQGTAESSTLMRFDPDKGGPPVHIPGTIGIRAATQETPQGVVYSVSQPHRGEGTSLYAFNTKTEEITPMGTAEVGAAGYIASLDVDPTGRYLYYCAGAHGGTEQDGCPLVQFDVKTRQKKVIAFLHPFDQSHYGCVLKGTYSSAVDPKSDKVYITWNAGRGSRAWDCCALTVVHIPESERQP